MLKRSMCALACAAAFGAAQAGEIPQSVSAQYRGDWGVPASMDFKRNGNSYTVSASIKVPFYNIRFESGGSIVGNQLRPSYYRDVRNGKVYASAKMSGNQASYGKTGETTTETVAGPVMDLFTVSWQLAFAEGKLPANLKITNGKGLYDVNSIKPLGEKQVKVAGGRTVVSQYHVRRGGDTVHYAFAPKLGNVPAIISYNDGDKKYNLTLTSVSINGKSVKPE